MWMYVSINSRYINWSSVRTGQKVPRPLASRMAYHVHSTDSVVSHKLGRGSVGLWVEQVSARHTQCHCQQAGHSIRQLAALAPLKCTTPAAQLS